MVAINNSYFALFIVKKNQVISNLIQYRILCLLIGK